MGDPRRQAALVEFAAAFGEEATLLDACLGLRMACSGAADPVRDEDKLRMLDALRARLDTWQPSHHPKWEAFDEAVRQLVVATLAEVDGG